MNTQKNILDPDRPLRIGLVGLGKIAVDQHIPAIRASRHWELVAGASPSGRPKGLPAYPTMAEMLGSHPEIDAIAICTPPQIRQAIAREAIAAGKHVFLEKPPAATVGEAEAIARMAKAHNVSLLASWHSRFAPAVEASRTWLAGRALSNVRIVWKENVRQWHPGQKWIFAPGGTGVFDPGINSLSILTHIVNDAVFVRKADLHVPVNCSAPIRAELEMHTEQGLPIRAEYDFLEVAKQTWSIFVETAAGERMALHEGGLALEIDGETVMRGQEAEYAGLYSHFHDLVRSGRSDADFSPLRIVADAFMVGRLSAAPAFDE
jgi:D-galactose 1-dehydrogenase